MELDTAESYRSPLLMNRHDTAMVVVDVQQKLLEHISGYQKIEWNIGRLIAGAGVLGVDVSVTEQYPQGLGQTVAGVLESLPGESEAVYEKLTFSCRECKSLFQRLNSKQIKNVLLVGIETHVCVLQSALDFMANGFDVLIAVDAVGSRFGVDYKTGLRRMESSGATLVTTEMALFEWCEIAGSAEFKQISQIVREPFAC